MAKRITYDEWRELQRKHPEITERATVRGGNRADQLNKWSNAKPTAVMGVQFPSKVQGAVFARLVEMYGRDNLRLDVRFPLLAGVKDNGRVLGLTVDFVHVLDGKAVLYVDAKTKRRSRDWARGASLFRATYGTLWEWNGTGDPPWIGS